MNGSCLMEILRLFVDSSAVLFYYISKNDLKSELQENAF